MIKYQRIRDLREDADLTQQQVGAAINVPQRTYAYYESGGRMLPPQVLCALADFYNVSVDYLLGRTDKKRSIGNIETETSYVFPTVLHIYGTAVGKVFKFITFV